jgi:hypothetical protein
MRKLEQLFDLPQSDSTAVEASINVQPTKQELVQLDADIDKIDAALRGISDVDSSDAELDELAELAKKSFNDLSDLGMNVDSRFASEIFSVASNMLGHAITAKQAKMNKKLKMIELQMKKMKLDHDVRDEDADNNTPTAQGQVLNRNDILERLLGSRNQNNNKA